MPLQYNNVDFGFQVTQAIDQTVRKDPSGTDPIGMTFNVKVRALLSAKLLLPDGGYSEESVSGRAKRLSHLLNQDRRRLVFTAPDGKLVIDTDVTPDVANGPRVTACTVTAISEAAWWVDFAVECVTDSCPENPAPRDVLSNRWSETNSYDGNGTATKRRTGLLIVATGQDPDGFRGLITPGVDPSFRRVAASYEVDETGLRCKYAFEDKQMHRPPPWPAFKMRGVMSETVPMPGAVRHGEFSIRLDAPKGTPHDALMLAAVRIGYNRAMASGINRSSSNGRFLMGGAIREILDDDVTAVELSLRWQMKADNKRIDGPAAANVLAVVGSAALDPIGFLIDPVGVINDSRSGTVVSRPAGSQSAGAQASGSDGIPLGYGNWVGKPLAGSDPNRAIGYGLRGTAESVGLFAAALSDPCGTSLSGLLTSAPGTAGVPADAHAAAADAYARAYTQTVTGDGATLTATAGPAVETPDDESGLYAADDGPGAYDHYVITSHYEDDSGYEVCPATADGADCVVVKMHGGSKRLRVEWSASRVGQPPVIPDPEPADPNIKYLYSTVSPEGTDMIGDAKTAKHVISGVYHFAFINRLKAPVVAPLPPYLAGTVAPLARLVAQNLGSDIIFGPAGIDVPGLNAADRNDVTGLPSADFVRDAGTAGDVFVPGEGGGRFESPYASDF